MIREVIHLYLRITGENLDFSGITKLTKLEPSVKCRKGECLGRLYGKMICATDCWQAEYEIPLEQSLDEATAKFLSACLQSNEKFSWPDQTRAEFWLSVYSEERYMSLRFSKKVLAMLAALGVDMSISITGLSDFYGKPGDD